MKITLYLAITYLIGMPILLRLFCHAQKKLVVDRAAAKAPKTKAAAANLPKPIWGTIKERLKFTLKDPRPAKINPRAESASGPPRRFMFLGLWVIGLLLFVTAGLTSKWILIVAGMIMFVFSIVFGVKSSKDVLETRKKVIQKMFEIGSSKGLVSNEYSDQPEAIIKVLEWNDFVKPQKVEYQVRTEFSSAGEEGFLQQFNQIFGNETAWVPSDDKETGAPGWNYDEGKVTIHAVPPLPMMAPWHERYVLDPAIAWSFFPLALGVENGVELPNPETGETEYVLGFDVSGEQAKVGKKAGVKVANAIVTSPMAFIGGGTGGGKSLSVDTPIKILKENNLGDTID